MSNVPESKTSMICIGNYKKFSDFGILTKENKNCSREQGKGRPFLYIGCQKSIARQWSVVEEFLNKQRSLPTPVLKHRIVYE